MPLNLRFRLSYLRLAWVVGTSLVLAAIFAGLVASGSPGSTPRERKVERRLVGTWRLLSAVTQDAEGKTVGYIWGRHPVGKLTYTRDRNMWVLVARRDAPKDVSPSFWYTGKFSVDLSHHRVVHHVRYSTIPANEGTDLLRPYSLRGDRLRLATAGRGQDRLVLRWKKVR